MYRIGELSKLCNIPVKTLRYYDSEGLLCPAEIDAFTGYRYYSAAQLSDCYRILALKELGFTLDEIRSGQNMPRQDLTSLLSAKSRELTALVDRTQQHITTLRWLSAALEEKKNMYNIIISKSEEIRIAYVRLLLTDRAESSPALAGLRELLPPEITGSRAVLIDYETEYRSGCFDTGIGMEITGTLPRGLQYSRPGLPDDANASPAPLILTEQIIRFPGETASLICGSAESDQEAYEQAVLALHQYLEEHHCQITGPTYRITYEDGTMEIKIPVCRLSAAPQAPRNDDIRGDFENDDRVIGHWELVDVLPSREQFLPGHPKAQVSARPVRELYFLPGGEWYWCFGWTKGYLLTANGYPLQQSRNAYTLEQIDGETYMFIEMRFRNYMLYGGQPEYWVLRQTDHRHYARRDIRIQDPIPQVPADDSRVIGTWEVCDLLRSPEDFTPGQPNFPHDALFWRRAQFLEGGEMYNTFGSAEEKPYTDGPGVWRWVTGSVIHTPVSTVSMYLFQQYGDTEYLFIQWKSGDYTFGGQEPYWYVFRREAIQ